MRITAAERQALWMAYTQGLVARIQELNALVVQLQRIHGLTCACHVCLEARTLIHTPLPAPDPRALVAVKRARSARSARAATRNI